ncbi:MAG TPA: hypothetical protein VJ982_01215 [Gemmatimonadota bacterium]|nr:hypothetical protein [Gemmatimonadota bacterium]
MTEHLEARLVYDLLDGRLDAAAESAAQAHLLRCDRCRELQVECAGVVDSLRWYGLESAAPPEGYWEGFWGRWSPDEGEARRTVRAPEEPAPQVVPLPVDRRGGWRLAPALATAAAVALLVGLWWSERPRVVETRTVVVEAPPLRQATAVSDWGEDYARFEQMAIAVGGVDPVSKGIVLASLAEAP